MFSRIDIDLSGEIDSDESEGVADTVIVGLKHKNFEIHFGKDDYVTDDFIQSFDYEMGGNTAFAETGGDDVISSTVEFGELAIRVSTDLEEGNDNGPQDESSIDAIVTYNVSNFTLGLAFQDYTASESLDEETMGIVDNGGYDAQGAFVTSEFGNTALALTYSTNDAGDFVQLAAEQQINDNWSAAAGYKVFSADVEAEDFNAYYGSVTYAFNDNVKVFTEVGDNDAEGNDFGWLTGLRVTF